MATTKVTTVLDNNIVLTASGATHTSSVWNLTTGYGGALHIGLYCSGTAPSTPASSSILASPDNVNWFQFGGSLVATSGSNVTSSWVVPIPIGIQYLEVMTGGNVLANMQVNIIGVQVTKV